MQSGPLRRQDPESGGTGVGVGQTGAAADPRLPLYVPMWTWGRQLAKGAGGPPEVRG